MELLHVGEGLGYIVFNNSQLNQDCQKFSDYDTTSEVAKNYDSNLDYPYILDISDSSYFYAEKAERDEDYETMKELYKNFSYI